MEKGIYVFKRFERFWHWAQALLIITMLITGFEIHGSYQFFGYEKAVEVHTTAAWFLIILWIFAIFWHFTTGEWKQYIPDTDMGMTFKIMKFYTVGIFTGDPHPYRVRPERKHNPLQRISYLSVKLLINPLVWISGLLYLFYTDWHVFGLQGLSLSWVALAHTIGAYLMLVFLIGHLYMITTGRTVFSQIKAMITGWDDENEAEDK